MGHRRGGRSFNGTMTFVICVRTTQFVPSEDQGLTKGANPHHADPFFIETISTERMEEDPNYLTRRVESLRHSYHLHGKRGSRRSCRLMLVNGASRIREPLLAAFTSQAPGVRVEVLEVSEPDQLSEILERTLGRELGGEIRVVSEENGASVSGVSSGN